MAKFLVSVLALNRLEFTQKCLEAVLRHSNDCELVVTNNGSTDGTREYLDSLRHPAIACITHNPDNRGFIGPNNAAFQLAVTRGAKYFVALNNDTVPPRGWLEMLAVPLDRNPKAALSGPQGGCHTLQKDMHGTGGGPFEYVEGSCLMAKVEIVKQFGNLFSDYLDFIYGDDSDLSLRMREKGYTIHQVAFQLPHSRGETVQKQPEVKKRCEAAQAHNHAVLMKRWHHYLHVRKFDYPTVIRRGYAIGDVLLTTPIVRAIKEAQPLSPIYVQTDFPAVFQHNPYVKSAAPGVARFNDAMVIDLNLAYENTIQTHIVRAYEAVARAVCPAMGEVSLKTEMFSDRQTEAWADQTRLSLSGAKEKLCLLHAGPTDWPGKNWHLDRFAQLATWLVMAGWHVAVVGSKAKPPQIRDSVDLTRRTSLHQLFALLKRTQLFIGIDSFPMHAAQAAGCPVIGLFGITNSRFILTAGSRAIGLEADPSIPCAGLRHRERGRTHISCSSDCIDSITLARVQAAVEEISP